MHSYANLADSTQTFLPCQQLLWIGKAKLSGFVYSIPKVTALAAVPIKAVGITAWRKESEKYPLSFLLRLSPNVYSSTP